MFSIRNEKELYRGDQPSHVHSTAQHSTAQHSTAQHSTVQNRVTELGDINEGDKKNYFLINLLQIQAIILHTKKTKNTINKGTNSIP
jgi:hypothetical protein